MTVPTIAVPFVAGFAGLLGGLILSWIKEEYIPYNYRERHNKLQELKRKESEVRQKLSKLDHQNNTAILVKDLENCKTEAQELLNGLNIEELETSIEARCMSSFLPHCYSRCAATCSIEGELKKCNKLLERFENFESKPQLRGHLQVLDKNVMETRRESIGRIWECLTTKHDVKVISIHGIAGVGKTAVAKAICNQALLDENQTFIYVIWVDAGYKIDPKILQDKIAKKAEIILPTTDDVRARASKLYEELVQRKKCLLIFDSLWEDFCLQKIVRIPEQIDNKDFICKIIITSRMRSVCLQVAETKHVEIKPLCHTKSWQLFRATMGDSNISDLEEKVKDALEACGGLPLLVQMLAMHLKKMHKKSLDEITALLKKISESGAESIVTKRQFKDLKYSYRRLDKTCQVCFLYCALYPKGCLIEVRRLIDYWIGEDLLESCIESLEERRKMGMKVLQELKDAHLLDIVDPNSGKEMVKVVSLFHDMAMNIIHREDFGFLSKAGNNLAHFPDINDKHRKIRRASFAHNRLRGLPRDPSFPALVTLLLHNNRLDVVSPSFFTKIPNLTVLDLSHTNISSLPESISVLENLRVLCLHCCSRLKELPPVSNLGKLIVLDLFGTLLEVLPFGMEKLKNLWRLDISSTKLTRFPANLLCELTKLQELLIIMDDTRAFSWRSQQMTATSGDANVEQLACLDGMTALHLNFFNIEVFKRYMSSIPATKPRPRSTSFKFCVGGVCTNRAVGENSIAFIDDYDHVDQLPEGTLELYLRYNRNLKTIEKTGIEFQNLKIIDVSDFTGLVYLFSFEMMCCLKGLEKLTIRRCWKMKEIIRLAEDSNHDQNTSLSCYLPRLQDLVVIDLRALENICSEQQLVLNWPAFCTLSIWHCENLKQLPEIVSQDGESMAPKSFNVRGKSQWFKSLEEAEIPKDMINFERLDTLSQEITTEPKPKDDQVIGFVKTQYEKARAETALTLTDWTDPSTVRRHDNPYVAILKRIYGIGSLFINKRLIEK